MEINVPTDVPTTAELAKFHEIFEQKESRHLDYWLAVKGVEKGLRTGDLKQVADSLATFLRSWNSNFYRFNPGKAPTLQDDLQHLITEYQRTLMTFRARSMTTLSETDRPTILGLFNAFEEILGPVGTAKTFNPLAPDFFPLWDNPISGKYGVQRNAQGYFLFMAVTKYQVGATTFPDGLWRLKTLDEFNYCNYTRHWLE